VKKSAEPSRIEAKFAVLNLCNPKNWK